MDLLEKNQQTFRSQNETRQAGVSTKLDHFQSQKPPLQCWGCVEPHYYKNWPHHTRTKPIANIQEASTVREMARNIPRINVALEDHQAEYRPVMIEFEGNTTNCFVPILIYPCPRMSYVSLKIVELCYLQSVKFKNPWLVQLATRAKRRVATKV